MCINSNTFMMIFIPLAKECTTPEVVQSTTQLGSGTSYGTVITYTCTGSTRFEDGTTSKTVECMGHWTESNVTCEGMLISLIL